MTQSPSSSDRPRRFTADPLVLEHFPGLTLVVGVALGIDNARPRPALDREWDEAWHDAASLEVPNAQSHPHVAHLRECFRGIGISHKKFPTSIEAMLRRALKGGEPFRINPLVDLYNALCLRHLSPAGAFDVGRLRSDVRLGFTSGGETFTALDDASTIEVDSREIAYLSGQDVLTRHFMWRQSRNALVHPDTRDVFFVSEIPGVAEPDTAERMREDFADRMRRHFAVEAVTDVLDASHASFTW